MSVVMILRIAMKALSRNKMRTALTMLGMIIGVAAVITMVALGTGAQSSIESQIQSAGTNMVMVSAGNFSQGGVRQGGGMATTLTVEDSQALRSVPGVEYLAAGVQSRAQLIAGNQNWSSQIQGTDVDLPLIRNWPMKYGSFFTAQDVSSAQKVAVLGTVVSNTLFGEDVDPTGQIIRVKSQPFKVIGVMASKGQSAMGQDQDDTVFVPIVWICASIDDCAPVPSATIVMTAATPMIMPSIVSAVRILFRLSALIAMRRIIRNDMPAPYDAASAGCASAASSSSATRRRVTGLSAIT